MGFALTVGVVGRPRATRVLRHLAVGAVLAADRAAREGVSGMKLSSEVVADRATLSARYQRSEPPRRSSESEPPPTSVRRMTTSFRPPSLSEEVERILSSHRAPASQRPRSMTPVPGSYRSSQPTVERTQVERAVSERTSDVQPVAKRASAPDGATETPAVPGELKRSSKA
jgi:hypothetical protein